MRSKNCGADQPLFRHYSTVCSDKSGLEKLMIMSSYIADRPGQAANSTRAERDIIFDCTHGGALPHAEDRNADRRKEGYGGKRSDRRCRYTPQSLPIHSAVVAQQITLWLHRPWMRHRERPRCCNGLSKETVMEDHRNGNKITRTETQASGGSKEGVVRYVLIVGLVLVVIAFVIAYVVA